MKVTRFFQPFALTMILVWIVGCGQTEQPSDASPTPEPAPAPEASPTPTPEPAPAPAAEASASPTDEPSAAFPSSWTLPEIDKSNARWKRNLPKPSLLSFEEGKSYFWQLDTNQGPMKIQLFHEAAPMHVTSTIYLTRLGFYDDIIFHRVIPGFMAQGGDPIGNGTGGPGYEYDGEFDAGLSHDRQGLLSMANRGPGTDGSQFFITFVPTPFLDGKHTIFGELVEGFETLAALEERGSRSGATSERLLIEKASIVIE